MVNNPHEAALGLYLCGLQLHMAAPARRTTPEALAFLRDCLSSYLPPSDSKQQQSDPDAFVRFPPGLLALSGKQAAAAAPPLELYGVLSVQPSDPWVSSDEFKLGLLRVGLCCVRRAAEMAQQGQAGGVGNGGGGGGDGEGGGGVAVYYDQLFQPLVAAVTALKVVKQLPADLKDLRWARVRERPVNLVVRCLAGRACVARRNGAHADHECVGQS